MCNMFGMSFLWDKAWKSDDETKQSTFQSFHGDWNYVLPCCFLHAFKSVRVNLNTLSLQDITIQKRSLGHKSDSLRSKKPYYMCYHHSHLYLWNHFFILALLHDCGLFLRQAGLWEQLWLLLRMYLELNLAQPDSGHFKISSALSEQTVSKHIHVCTYLLYHTSNVLTFFIPCTEG